MVSTIQTYQLNNKQVEVDLTQVPEISLESQNILIDLCSTNLPTSLKTAAPLRNKIQTMENTMEALQETKETGTKQKIIALLKTALIVGLAAGLILSCIFGGPIGFGIVIGIIAATYMVTSGVLGARSLEIIENIEMDSPEYLNSSFHRHGGIIFLFFAFSGFTGGVIMPLYEAYTREARLTRVLNEQQNAIRNTMSQYKAHNDQVLPIAHPFYRDRTAEAVNKLNRRMDQLQEQNLSDMPSECLGLVKSRVEALARARDELIHVAKFYRQFDPAPVQA